MPDPPSDAAGHYSDSPFLARLGTRLEEWRDGHARIGLTLAPQHLNRSGVVHGGVLAALLEHAGGVAGLLPRWAPLVTLSEHALNGVGESE